MFIRMASSAMATESIDVGGAVVEPFAVHPALTAQSLATLDELSGGRATLAIGAGGSGFQMMGISRRHSAQAVKEAYIVMKRLLAGEEVTFEGELIQAHAARLQFNPNHQVPLWVATRGDLTLESSGEYADAVMIATNASPLGFAEAIRLVEKGARRAGRSTQEMRLMARVDTCIHPGRDTAYQGTRLMIARFLASSYPNLNFVHRAGLEVPPEIEALLVRKDASLLGQVAQAIPEEFIPAFCWAGTPEMIAGQVIELARSSGIREFGFWLLLAPGQTRKEAVRLLAGKVLSLIRAAVQ
jgi:5,10-methylenetetrahydromethanopterin reductase